MKRLLLLGVLLTSYLNAGMYGGVEWQKASFNGTYKETYKGETQEWDTTAALSVFGLNLGYGHADATSGEIYFVTDFDGGKLGSNLSYGFDLFDNNLFPHILIGNGALFTEDPSLSNNPNLPQGSARDYGVPFVQLGVGLSYALSDTIEFYGDVLLLVGLVDDDSSDGYDVYEYDENSGTSSVYPLTQEQTWDNPSIGFRIGIKFHALGSSTMDGKHLKQEVSKLEEERQKNIDTFMD